jgi:hypothetical protein
MPWHVPPARSRRPPPSGFIAPCRPTLVANPPAGPGWLHEVKHDGFRTLARKQGERVEGGVRQRQPAFVIARVRRSPASTRSTASSRVSGCHYEELPRLVSLTCARPSSRSWRIASARLERRRSKRKPSTRSTRLRGREIVVTRAGGPSAFATMALRPRASLSDRRPPQARPRLPGRQSGLAFARGPVAAKELTHARPRCFTSLWHHDCMYANAEAAGVSLAGF